MSSKLLLVVLASIVSLAASAPSVPRECSQTSLPPSASTAAPGNASHPLYFNIYQSETLIDHPTDNVKHIDLHANITRQVAVFTGIPSTAKTCSLGWRQGPAETRTFRVEGSGLVSSRQLKTEGFPEWTVGSDVRINPTTIAPFRGDDEFSAGMDFTFWNGPEYPAKSHGGPGVECKEKIVVELAVNLNNGQAGRVFMQDDAENGLYIAHA